MKNRSRPRPSPTAGYWPDHIQELLLRAALLPGAVAVDSFMEWRSLADPDHLDQGSYRMLPLLFRNLSGQGIRDPFLNLCQGVHRQTWYRNQIQLSRIRELLNEFHKQGIDIMLLKGAALALFYYADCGLRFFEDIDLLVPTRDAQSAFHLLRRRGWWPSRFPVREISREHTSTSHAVAMVNDRGVAVDLHWHLLSECLAPDADDDFWRSAERVETGPAPVYVLTATDQLFHACMHGFKHQANWEQVPPIRWVADALTVMAAGRTRLDFQRLGSLARERHLVLALKLTLNYLRNKFSATVPPSFIREMENWPVAGWEIAEFRTAQKPSGMLGSLPLMWCHYRRLGRDRSPGQTNLNFAGYLQHRFFASRRRDLPFILLGKGVRRIGRWIGAIRNRRLS